MVKGLSQFASGAGNVRSLLYTVFIVVAIILIIYYLGKRAGFTNRPKKQELPNSGSGIPTTWDPEPLATKIYEKLSGISFISSAWPVLIEWLNLPTDDMKVAVYNEFNRKYFNKSDGTLRQWVDDEYPIILADFSTKSRLLSEMSRLKLM